MTKSDVTMTKSSTTAQPQAATRISDRLAELGDWRGDALRRVRTLIQEADPDVVEEWKWAKATSPGVPVWSHDGIICTGESYKSAVKLTFARGASLEDPAHIFNASLEGNVRRAIDIREGEQLDEAAFKALIRAAVSLNQSGKSASSRRSGGDTAATAKAIDSAVSAQEMASRRTQSRMAKRPTTQSQWKMAPGRSKQPAGESDGDNDAQAVIGETTARRRSQREAVKAAAPQTRRRVSRAGTRRSEAPGSAQQSVSTPGKTVLLAGGNPQIAKGDGDGPVQKYIAAMPGWKAAVGHRLDTLIMRAVPQARKAVKWNSPFYGIEGRGWFLNFHCFARYVKIAFFKGSQLRPLPPGHSKQKDVRYLDIYENDTLDESLLKKWFTQAAKLPGAIM